MNILFWLEPHFELARPGVMRTWLEWYERLAGLIQQQASATAVRFIALDSPAARARAASLGERLLLLSQNDLRLAGRLTGEALPLLEHDLADPALIGELGRLIEQRLAGFVPDFVFLHHQQPWLRRLLPKTTFINIELSWTSRPPFPLSWHLDLCGAGKGRVLAEHGDALIAGWQLNDRQNQWLDAICLQVRTQLTLPAVEAELRPLRQRATRLTLLPLGLFDRFDGCTPLFAALDAFLERQDGRTIFILTQHPLWPLLNPEQTAHLLGRHPHVVSSGCGSQELLPWVDQVIGDFSTVATQGLFFGSEIRSIRHELNHIPADTPLCNPLADWLSQIDIDGQRRALFWLLRHYAVPEHRLFDGPWLVDFLERAGQAVKLGQPWTIHATEYADESDWNTEHWRPLMLPEQPVAPVAPPVPPVSVEPTPAPAASPTVTESAVADAAAQTDERRYRQALALLAAGDRTAAFEALRELAEAGTGIWQVYHELAMMAVVQGDLDSAILLFAMALDREPAASQPSLHLARLQQSAGQYEEALKTLGPLLRADPNHHEALPLVRELLGAAPALSPVTWAGLLAQLRTLPPDLRRQLDAAAAQNARLAAVTADNRRLQMQIDRLRQLARAPGDRPNAIGWDEIHALPDEQWLQALIDSIEYPAFRGFPLPSFPAEGLQIGTVGSSNETALREGFGFYRLVKQLCVRHGLRFRPGLRLLDFGTGWGRYARIFLKDFRPEDIVGVDVDASFVDVCRQTFPYGQFETVPPFPPTSLPDGGFDLVIAYSVFSHLSEPAASAWVREFSRLLRPGGMIAITTQGRTFIDFCEGIRASGRFDHPWHQNLARSFTDADACRAAYDRGEFLFAPTGGGDARPSTFYGEALIPEGFVVRHWSAWLEPLEFIDDRQRLAQALIIMRKPT